jgi:menaquinone reductase, molybdopterin-binding-like subunit
MVKPVATLTRRNFLRLTAGVAAGTALTAALNGRRPTLADIHGVKGRRIFSPQALRTEKTVPTVCLMCASGCGMQARVVDGRLVKVEGSSLHPVNLGALCPKGQASPELLYNPDRIHGPLRRTGERGQGNWEPIPWETALSLVAQRLTQLRGSGHPERFAFLYGDTRGQMRELITRFTHAVGSPNAISHDSLGLEAIKLGNLLTQGVRDSLAYDLENCNYLLSFGSSLLESGRAVQRFIAGYAYIRRGRPDRGKVVVVDGRQGISGAKADEWIPTRPGTEAALALGMAHAIISAGLFDAGFVHDHAFGFEDWEESGVKHKGFKSLVLEKYSPEQVAEITGIAAGTITRLAGEFAVNRPSMAVIPHENTLLNGSANGLYAAMAIHCLNALVGNIEAPGGVQVQRYPVCPGWPELPPDTVAAAGRATPRLDGAGTVFPLARHAYQALPDRLRDGRGVDVLFLYDANCMYECPGGAARWQKAFDGIDTIVSFSSFLNDTTRHADFVLPDHTFLERWQDDFVEGIGYPGVALRQPVVEPVRDTKNTGDVLIELAHRVGGYMAVAFPWSGFQELLKQQLSEVGTSWETLSSLGVWATPPYERAERGSDAWANEIVGKDRQSAPRDGYFDFFSRELACRLGTVTPDLLVKLGIQARGDEVFLPHYEPVSFQGDETQYPFVLDVVTLMSLGTYSANANLPSLQEISGMTVDETWDSWLEMNPAAARDLGLLDRQPVWVESPFGKAKTRVRFVPGLRPDMVVLPYNQGHRGVGRYAEDRGVNGLELMGPTSEPLTGLAAFGNTRVKVYPA